MTMHITKFVKKENRKTKGTNENGCLYKIVSRMKPLKIVALAILIFLPFFSTPSWCVKKKLVD
jgi:hypothetical protein